MLNIMYYQIFVETHWSIGKVEKYHTSMHHVYNIIQAETQSIISKNIMLQMVFKAVNNTTRPNGLVPTLLVFDAYPRIVIDLLPLSPQ